MDNESKFCEFGERIDRCGCSVLDSPDCGIVIDDCPVLESTEAEEKDSPGPIRR
jgi:hypothetical protein